MPKIRYKPCNFQAGSLKLIKTCNEIIAEYQAQGFTLTLRQLYYQLVSRDVIANRQKEYKRLGSIVNDARLAGLIDWMAIMRQVEEYEPPPNPAKTTDSRYAAYIAEFGAESWELDALEPAVIAELIRGAVAELIDGDLWDRRKAEIEKTKQLLGLVAKDWNRIVESISRKRP